MVNVIKQEVKMEEHLRKRLEFICKFCKVKPTIINSENLKVANKKSSKLKHNSKDIKDKIDKLKHLN